MKTVHALLMPPDFCKDPTESFSLDAKAWPILKVDDPSVYNPDGIAICVTLPGDQIVEVVIPVTTLDELYETLDDKMIDRDVMVVDDDPPYCPVCILEDLS